MLYNQQTINQFAIGLALRGMGGTGLCHSIKFRLDMKSARTMKAATNDMWETPDVWLPESAGLPVT
jgi:hypothetical protein